MNEAIIGGAKFIFGLSSSTHLSLIYFFVFFCVTFLAIPKIAIVYYCRQHQINQSRTENNTNKACCASSEEKRQNNLNCNVNTSPGNLLQNEAEESISFSEKTSEILCKHHAHTSDFSEEEFDDFISQSFGITCEYEECLTRKCFLSEISPSNSVEIREEEEEEEEEAAELTSQEDDEIIDITKTQVFETNDTSPVECSVKELIKDIEALALRVSELHHGDVLCVDHEDLAHHYKQDTADEMTTSTGELDLSLHSEEPNASPLLSDSCEDPVKEEWDFDEIENCVWHGFNESKLVDMIIAFCLRDVLEEESAFLGGFHVSTDCGYVTLPTFSASKVDGEKPPETKPSDRSEVVKLDDVTELHRSVSYFETESRESKENKATKSDTSLEATLSTSDKKLPSKRKSISYIESEVFCLDNFDNGDREAEEESSNLSLRRHRDSMDLLCTRRSCDHPKHYLVEALDSSVHGAGQSNARENYCHGLAGHRDSIEVISMKLRSSSDEIFTAGCSLDNAPKSILKMTKTGNNRVVSWKDLQELDKTTPSEQNEERKSESGSIIRVFDGNLSVCDGSELAAWRARTREGSTSNLHVDSDSGTGEANGDLKESLTFGEGVNAHRIPNTINSDEAIEIEEDEEATITKSEKFTKVSRSSRASRSLEASTMNSNQCKKIILSKSCMANNTSCRSDPTFKSAHTNTSVERTSTSWLTSWMPTLNKPSDRDEDLNCLSEKMLQVSERFFEKSRSETSPDEHSTQADQLSILERYFLKIVTEDQPKTDTKKQHKKQE